MNFLPTDYKIPKAPSGYMKFEEGLNTIRILSSAIVGYEYWTKDKKPVRSKTMWEDIPTDIKVEDDGTVKIKPFWAFVVWNYEAKKVQILEITQNTIMKGIKSLVDNPKWGDPKKYDIAITRIEENITSYNVQGEPPIEEPTEEIMKAYKAKPINLNALYSGEDPFAKEIKIEKEDLPA